MKTKEELKLQFENGDKPTQEDFWALLDSYWHKSEKLGNNALNLITYLEFTYSPTDSTEITGNDSIIVFPEGIKIIGGFRFNLSSQNRITKIQFPQSLETIRANAFGAQYLRGSLKIPGSCKVIEANAFNSAVADVSELILEKGVEIIGDSAFQFLNNKNLTDLYIPSSVKSVGQNAFNIPSLKTVSALNGLDLSNAGIPETAVIMRYVDL
ncbi:leucine-rich repeat domain-containing protein [Chryseobacterium sp. SIMBA_029]|uniref:leucine-rich repeat domain-containing protein n=1 Tax=Chryseobacterium sp. SIMBA_029 TaxID=3085772 RepID=UPI00397D981C